MWSQTYGGSGFDRPYAMLATYDGGYVIAGQTNSFGAGTDYLLVKTDEKGNYVWNNTYGGPAPDIAYSLIETSDGGYAIAGELDSYEVWIPDDPLTSTGTTIPVGAGLSDFWLVKTDENGNVEWNQTYGGANHDGARCLIETSDGGYAIAGYTHSFGAGAGDVWLIKTDKYGNMEWNWTYGGEENEGSLSLVEVSNGGYALAGYKYSFDAGAEDFWLVKTDEFGNMEWNQTYGGGNHDRANSLVETSDGGYALAGVTTSFGDEGPAFWLVKTDENGNMEWNQYYGTKYDDRAYSLVKTFDGGFAIVGSVYSEVYSGGSDFWLVKTDENGNMDWNQTYGGTGDDEAYALVETSDRGYAIAGITHSFGAGNGDFWLIKTDEYGVIPEFPSWTILPLLMIASLLAITFKKKAFHTFHN